MENPELRSFEPADRDWLVQQHQELYAKDEGFDETFGPFVAQIIDAFLTQHDRTCEKGWVAEREGQRLGTIFCTKHSPTTARLKMFFLVHEARGLGLGRRMLLTCMNYAKAKNYKDMWLWTHESHEAACALYRANGWQLGESNPAHSFGRDVVEQVWNYRF